MSKPKYTYTFYFMRGDKRTITSDSESNATKSLYKTFPETHSWDILKVVSRNQ